MGAKHHAASLSSHVLYLVNSVVLYLVAQYRPPSTRVEISNTVGSAREPFVIHFFHDRGPVKITLFPELYSTDPTARRFPSACHAEGRMESLMVSDTLPIY